MSEIATRPAAEVTAAPQPFWKGNVAIYETPDGGAVVAYRGEHDQADSHHAIPAAAWQLMGTALRGEAVDLNPVQLLKTLMRR